MVSISGKKTWIDPAGTTHPTVTIDLYRDGGETPYKTATIDNGKTEYSFTGLEKYNLTDGHEYVYTIQEKAVSGYTTSPDTGYTAKTSRDDLNFTNTIEQGLITLSGTKTWRVPEGKDIPEITIELYRDNETTPIKQETLSSGTTSYEFKDLAKYDLTDGHEYSYTVKEVAVTGFTTEPDSGYTGIKSSNNELSMMIKVNSTSK